MSRTTLVLQSFFSLRWEWWLLVSGFPQRSDQEITAFFLAHALFEVEVFHVKRNGLTLKDS